MWICCLPVHIDPAGCTGFTEIFGESETSHWADRVVGPYGEISMHSYPVGADDSVRPRDAPLFTGISGESVLPANFDRKANLPQPFKGSYYQVWCTAAGGA